MEVAAQALASFFLSTPAAAGRKGGAATRERALTDATGVFKALSHPGRLQILCHLMNGERSVSELENLLNTRQSVVSQHLARLRSDGLVSARRDRQAIFYSLRDTRLIELLTALTVYLDAAEG